MKTLTTLAAAAIIAALFPASALAQDAIVSGPGVKLNEDYVLRPSAGAEVGFVSNVFYDAENVDSSGVLQILAGLEIESITAGGRTEPLRDESGGTTAGRAVDYGLGLQLRYEEYLSSDTAVQAQRDLAAQARGRVLVFPGRSLSFFLNDQFIRDTRSPNFESSDNLVRYVNKFRAGVRWQPPGRSLSGHLRYQNTIDAFEDFDFADRFQHEFQLLGRWHWLPITSFYARVTQGIYTALGDGTLNGMPYTVNSFPLDLRVGFDTAITELTTVKLFAGWGFGFYEAGTDYSSAIYGAEFGLRYSPMGRITAGFARQFNDSINANFYSEYRFSVGVAQQVDRFSLRAEGVFALRNYQGIPDEVTTAVDSRDDAIMSLGASARFHLRDTIAFSAGYDLALVETDFRGAAGGEPDDPSYVRHQVLVGAHAAF